MANCDASSLPTHAFFDDSVETCAMLSNVQQQLLALGQGPLLAVIPLSQGYSKTWGSKCDQWFESFLIMANEIVCFQQHIDPPEYLDLLHTMLLFRLLLGTTSVRIT